MTPAGSGNRFPSILARYLAREFSRVLVLCLVSFVVVYLVVEFFDRFDDFLKHGAEVSPMVRYFLFKIPQVITEVTPVAVLASMLLSLGGFSRNNEITAMRAGGVSSAQIVAPLLLVIFGLSLGCLVWNETVVPHFSRQVHYINTVEIKKKELPGLLGDRGIWTHGQDAFYNIDSFDNRKKRLAGVTIYSVDREFHLRGIIEIPQADWDGSRWLFGSGRERRFLPSGEIETISVPAGVLDLREKPTDLMVAHRDAEEFSYFTLRDLIENFRRKGIDLTEYLVDLHLKLAVPFISTVMGLIAIPLGLRNLRASSLAHNVGTGLVIGFSYWVVLALAVSLGHSGALPPMIAAWTANVIFAGIGLFLLLGAL